MAEILEQDCRECYRHRTSRMMDRLRPGGVVDIVNCGVVTMGEMLREVMLYLRCADVTVWVRKMEGELLRELVRLMGETCHVNIAGEPRYTNGVVREVEVREERVWVDKPLVKSVMICTGSWSIEDYDMDLGRTVSELVRDGRMEIVNLGTERELLLIDGVEHPRISGQRGMKFSGDLPQKRWGDKKVSKIEARMLEK